MRIQKITDIPAPDYSPLDHDWLTNRNTPFQYSRCMYHGVSEQKGTMTHNEKQLFIKFFYEEDFFRSTQRILRCLSTINMTHTPKFNFIDDPEVIQCISPDPKTFPYAITSDFITSSDIDYPSIPNNIKKQLAVNNFTERLLTIYDRCNATHNIIYNENDKIMYTIDFDSSLGFNESGYKINLQNRKIHDNIYDRITCNRSFSKQDMPRFLEEHDAHRIGLRIKAKFKDMQKILKPDEFDVIEHNVITLLDETRDAYKQQRAHERAYLKYQKRLIA